MRPRNNINELKKQLRELVPLANMEDFLGILTIAEAGHLRHLPASIRVWQAATTYARHQFTEYDALLEEGYDAESARHFVLAEINEKLESWGSRRRIEEEES